LNERVYALVRSVPPGRVMSYGAVARHLGAPGKAREVGWAMHQCPDDVPAHRVLNRFGEVSGDLTTSGAEIRRVRLEAEGVLFDEQGRCDLGCYGWLPSSTDDGTTLADARDEGDR
jgi:methylated-DNA-protein-cysteine methyltransferase-like protein